MEDRHINKSHNKSLLLYHIVCPAKYRRKVFSKDVEKTLKQVCKGISLRYEIHFIEIGTDEDHVQFSGSKCPNVFSEGNSEYSKKYHSHPNF